MHFLQQIPVDPFTGEAEWGKRSYQDDWDATSWGRENVWDVYTLYPGRLSMGLGTKTGDRSSRDVLDHGAEGGIRTPTPLRAPPPQDGVSASSTTSARGTS